MANVLPPPPVNDQQGSWAWMEWYRQLRQYVAASGSVPWYIIDFSESNITDISSRQHNELQSIQGGTAGERYHLTAAQHAALSAGNHNDLSGIQGGTVGSYYHINANQYAAISNSLEVLNTAATTACPTTPTVLTPSTTVISNGITYNSSTGEIVFTNGGSYALTLMLNATTTSSNKNIYFYAEVDTGSGYAIRRYSARSAEITNSITQQYLFASSNYFAKGTKIKLYVWGSDTGINFVSTDLPGTTPGTATVPAVRLMWSGSL